MAKARNIPHHTRMFLYRQGLKMLPSQNFIDKFIEIYNELLYTSKARQHIPPIDEKQAIFFINSAMEAIIYCLDFGFSVQLGHTWLLTSRVSDYRHNVKTSSVGVIENVKKITITPIMHLKNKIKRLINQDNVEYTKFLQQKKERHDNVKRYYRKLYGKENEWWTGIPEEE